MAQKNENKTHPTEVPVSYFLETVSEKRKAEAQQLIELMEAISGQPAVMWGPSIIGFGSRHYRYESGREGDTGVLGFSPRKARITIYFNEGFEVHRESLKTLGKHKTSVSCLYVNKLADIDLLVLKKMLEDSWHWNTKEQGKKKAETVEEYIAQIPQSGRERFDQLRDLVRSLLPDAKEVLSYGIIGYKTDKKRAKVFISGWKDHVAMYPVPQEEELLDDLKLYIHGKGTLWFLPEEPLPEDLIRRTVRALVRS